MGGLFTNDKKNTAHGPHTKLSAIHVCNKCGRWFDSNSTYYEYNNHLKACLLKHTDNQTNKETKVLPKKETKTKTINSNSNSQVNKNIGVTKAKYSLKKHNHQIFKNDVHSGLIIFDGGEFDNPTENKKPHKKMSTKISSSISEFNSQYMKDFPFEDKLVQFRNQIKHLKVDWRDGACTLLLDRDNFISQSIDQFAKIDPYKELKINFQGEISHDAGGLIREWFTIIFQELQNENMELFERSDSADFSYKIHKNSQATMKTLDLFTFIGKVIAKALLENLTVNACFNKLIYKIILDEDIKLDDLIFIDKPLYHSLKELTKTERICELGLYFAVMYESNKKLVCDELILDGNNVLVTNQNVDNYIDKRIHHIQQKEKIFVNEIKTGLYSIIPEKMLKIFTSDELELLLNGQPFIDVSDWKSNTIYKGYSESSQVILNFWDRMLNLQQQDLMRFLQFCTGSSRVPIGGFSALESNRGNKAKFCITKVPYIKNSKNFIKAHTCFNRVDLPEFPNKYSVEEAVNYIIANEILGFGID